MNRIFVDTNILLDVVLHRDKFVAESARIWNECESKQTTGLISAISLNNIHYIARKQISSTDALECVRHILNVFTIVPLDTPILRMAVDLPQQVFEDAIQIFSALHAKADCIITRDRQHFSSDYLPILTPTEYLEIKDTDGTN